MKQNGEYCWKEYDAIKTVSSSNYPILLSAGSNEHLEELFNNIYFDMYYKDYKNFELYNNLIDKKLDEKLIIFPILKIIKLFLVLNSSKSPRLILIEYKDVYEEIKQYTLFYSGMINELVELLDVSFKEDIDERFFTKIKNDVMTEVKDKLVEDITKSELMPYDTGATQRSLVTGSKVNRRGITLKNTEKYDDYIYTHGGYGRGSFKRDKPGLNTRASLKWFDKYARQFRVHRCNSKRVRMHELLVPQAYKDRPQRKFREAPPHLQALCVKDYKLHL